MSDRYEETYTLKQERDCKTGKILCEVFYNAEGRKDRGGLPSLVFYDGDTGEPKMVFYHKNGEEHRIDGPASYDIDPITKVVTREFWLKDGELHRDDGFPAIIHRHPETGEISYQGFYLNGCKIRPDIKGIAANNPSP